jgi:NADH-quinone oxidoreductase subunit C
MDFNKLKEQLRALAILEDVVVEEVAADSEQIEGAEPEVQAAPEPEQLPAMSELDHQAKGFDLDVKVEADNVVDAAKILDEQGFFLEAVTGVDWLKEKQLEVVYDYCLWQPQYRVVIRTRLDRDNPVVPTISEICPGADWHERETFDFFGIEFSGHPNLIPILLPEDSDFHPLLKDFEAQAND